MENKLIHLFVDDKDYDSEDGFDLYSESPYEISIAVKMAIENDFKDIRISKATPEECLEYYKSNLRRDI